MMSSHFMIHCSWYGYFCDRRYRIQCCLHGIFWPRQIQPIENIALLQCYDGPIDFLALGFIICLFLSLHTFCTISWSSQTWESMISFVACIYLGSIICLFYHCTQFIVSYCLSVQTKLENSLMSFVAYIGVPSVLIFLLWTKHDLILYFIHTVNILLFLLYRTLEF